MIFEVTFNKVHCLVVEYLVGIFCDLGISKIRVTGGEPFSRRGCLTFLSRLRQLKGVKNLHITTNGVKTSRHLDELANIGLDGINLSLDTLDPKTFWKITRRDYLESVLQTLHGVLERGIPLKINKSKSLSITSCAVILLLTTIAKHSRVYSSIMFNILKARPSAVRSIIKS